MIYILVQVLYKAFTDLHLSVATPLAALMQMARCTGLAVWQEAYAGDKRFANFKCRDVSKVMVAMELLRKMVWTEEEGWVF